MTKHFTLAGLLLLLVTPLVVSAQDADFTGKWMPVPGSGTLWQPDELPLTQAARDKLADFDPRRLDSTYFCMPYGTPRNTLNTAPQALEIVQTDNQLTLLFDGLGDVRRIYIDGRSHPEDPIPGWMGSSTGTWQDNSLLVETIALTSESILNEYGLPHSESARVEEQLQLVSIDGEVMLQNRIQLTDPMYYDTPLTTTRLYRNAPNAQMSEGSSLCLMNQWRKRLENINREMYQHIQEIEGETSL